VAPGRAAPKRMLRFCVHLMHPPHHLLAGALATLVLIARHLGCELSRLSTVRTDNAAQVHFSATLDQDLEGELALV
jgi:hypothetical protein